VESEPGEGSTFTLVLPSDPDMRPSAKDVRAEDRVAPRQTMVALLVDDDPSIHDLYAAYVHGERIRLLHAYDLSAARRLLHAYPVSVVLLDLLFEREDEDGWGLIAEIEGDRSLQGVRVVIQSVCEEPSDAKSDEYDAYLVKPVSQERLLEAMRRAQAR
jgi:DNA-binding NtrC family response regulator